MKTYRVTFEFSIRDGTPLFHGWVRTNYSFIVSFIRDHLRIMEDNGVLVDNFYVERKR